MASSLLPVQTSIATLMLFPPLCPVHQYRLTDALLQHRDTRCSPTSTSKHTTQDKSGDVSKCAGPQSEEGHRAGLGGEGEVVLVSEEERGAVLRLFGYLPSLSGLVGGEEGEKEGGGVEMEGGKEEVKEGGSVGPQGGRQEGGRPIEGGPQAAQGCSPSRPSDGPQSDQTHPEPAARPQSPSFPHQAPTEHSPFQDSPNASRSPPQPSSNDPHATNTHDVAQPLHSLADVLNSPLGPEAPAPYLLPSADHKAYILRSSAPSLCSRPPSSLGDRAGEGQERQQGPEGWGGEGGRGAAVSRMYVWIDRREGIVRLALSLAEAEV